MAAEVPTLPQHGLLKNQPTCQASASLCLQALTRKCVMWELLHIHPQLKRENPPGTSTAKWDNLMVTISQHETAFGLTDQWWHWNGQRTAGRKSKAGFLSMRVTLLWGGQTPIKHFLLMYLAVWRQVLIFHMKHTWVKSCHAEYVQKATHPTARPDAEALQFHESTRKQATPPAALQHPETQKPAWKETKREKYHNLQLWGLRADLCLQPGKWADLKLSFTNKYSLITCGPSALGVRQQQPS